MNNDQGEHQNLEESALPPGLRSSLHVREVKVKWSTFTEAEKIVLTIQMARVLYASQEFANEFDKRLDELLEKINQALDRIENIADILRKGPGGGTGAGTPGQVDPKVAKAIRFIKVIDYATIAAKASRVMLQVSVAVWPSEISDFYIDIDNQKRPVGDKPVTIPVGTDKPFSVYLIPQSPGWTKKITREDLLKEAVSLLLKHFPGANKVPDERAQERRVEIYGQVMDEMKKRFPAIAKWLGVGYTVAVIQKQKYPAFQLNDVRFVHVESRSKNLIEFTPPRRESPEYRIRGLAEGQNAGYEFRLRDERILAGFPTVREIVQQSGTRMEGTGVVNVSGSGKKPPATRPDRPCGPETPGVPGGKTGICTVDGRCTFGGAYPSNQFDHHCR